MTSTSTRFGAGLSIIGVAFAQLAPASRAPKRFSLPVQSPAGQFLEGLVGVTPKNVWFVIVGSHLRAEDAETQANELNHQYPEFRADVYEPYGDNPYYAVVIGANLTQSEAKALRDEAVRAGLPKDSYYKTFPNLPPAVQQPMQQ